MAADITKTNYISYKIFQVFKVKSDYNKSKLASVS